MNKILMLVTGLFYLPELIPAEHNITVRILELPAGEEYFLGHINVVGTVLK